MYAHGRWITKRRLIGAVAAVAVIGLGVSAAVFLPDVLGSGSADPTSSPTADLASCPSTRLAGGDAQLGTVAWVDGGALLLLDLDTCEERTLVQVGAVPPVRLSHDGAMGRVRRRLGRPHRRRRRLVSRSGARNAGSGLLPTTCWRA